MHTHVCPLKGKSAPKEIFNEILALSYKNTHTHRIQSSTVLFNLHTYMLYINVLHSGACGKIITFSAGHLYDPIKFLMHIRIEEGLINTNKINNN